jgi:hypothetical protein
VDFRDAGGRNRTGTLGHRRQDLVTTLSEICKKLYGRDSHCIGRQQQYLSLELWPGWFVRATEMAKFEFQSAWNKEEKKILAGMCRSGRSSFD